MTKRNEISVTVRPVDPKRWHDFPLPTVMLREAEHSAVVAGILALLDDYFLAPEELARRWKIEVQTLANNRRCQRGLPYVKVNRLVRYRLSDVLRVEIQGSTGPIPPRQGGAYLRSRAAFDDKLPLSQRTCPECGAYR